MTSFFFLTGFAVRAAALITGRLDKFGLEAFFAGSFKPSLLLF